MCNPVLHHQLDNFLRFVWTWQYCLIPSCHLKVHSTFCTGHNETKFPDTQTGIGCIQFIRITHTLLMPIYISIPYKIIENIREISFFKTVLNEDMNWYHICNVFYLHEMNVYCNMFYSRIPNSFSFELIPDTLIFFPEINTFVSPASGAR